RRLADVHGPVGQSLDGRAPGRGHRVPRLEALLREEAAGNGGDERRVEGGEAGELDADVVAHGFPPGRTTISPPCTPVNLRSASLWPRCSSPDAAPSPPPAPRRPARPAPRRTASRSRSRVPRGTVPSPRW